MWIGCGSQGFWQQISYEKIPSYCKYCKKQGLEEIKCIFKDPSQLKPRQNKVRKEIITKPIYVEKQKGKNQIEVEIVDQETGPIQEVTQEEPDMALTTHVFQPIEVSNQFKIKHNDISAEKVSDIRKVRPSAQSWKYIWSKHCPNKICIFSWKVMHNVIPTDENIMHAKVPVSQKHKHHAC